MPVVHVELFGKLSVSCAGRAVAGLDGGKVRELLCYLLIHRGRSHPRSVLAGLFWSESSTAQAHKYLRQTLWHLHAAFSKLGERPLEETLTTDADWVRLDLGDAISLDVDRFENAHKQCQNAPGAALDAAQARLLREAVELYRGDLMEGCYLDWCLYERERLQNIQLTMLDKLMVHCEAQREFEQGIEYGERVLLFDRAHERTHRRLMRLHYAAGNRGAALRQFEHCAAALRAELGVQPARRTLALYEQIRSDRLEDEPIGHLTTMAGDGPLILLLQAFQRLRLAVGEVDRQIQEQIDRLEVMVGGDKSSP